MNNLKSILKSSSKAQYTPLYRSLLIAGISFIVVCLIGVIAQQIVDHAGNLNAMFTQLHKDKSTNWYNLYKGGASEYSGLRTLLFASSGLTILSFVLSIVWSFRVLRASKGFIFFAFATYVLAQGLGFGTLFIFLEQKVLVGIFGIAGGIFLVMGIIGYTAKNLLPLGKLLMIGTFFVLGFFAISMLLHFMGVGFFGKKTYLFMSIFTGILSMGWIAFDIWNLKRTSQWLEYSNADEEMKFRIVWFFGFKLLSDMVMLIWQLVRIFMLTRD